MAPPRSALVRGVPLEADLVAGRDASVVWRRSPWLRCLLAIALVALALTATQALNGDQGPQVATAPEIVEFGAPVGPRTTGPVAVCFIVDDSGSIGGADPFSARGGELAAALRWMAAWGRPDDQVGFVVHIVRAAVTVPLTAPGDAATVPLATLTTGAPVGGGTEFTDGARLANDMLMSSSAERRVAVFVTDGDGPDTVSASAALDATIERYVIGLDGDGAWKGSRKSWQKDVGPRQTWRVGRIHPGDLARPIASLLSELTGQQVGTRVTSKGGRK